MGPRGRVRCRRRHRPAPPRRGHRGGAPRLHVGITGAPPAAVLTDRPRPSPFIRELDGSAPKRPAVRTSPRTVPGGRLDARPHPSTSSSPPKPSLPRRRCGDRRSLRLAQTRYKRSSLNDRHLVVSPSPGRDAVALAACDGIGLAKLERYGDQILDVLSASDPATRSDGFPHDGTVRSTTSVDLTAGGASRGDQPCPASDGRRPADRCQHFEAERAPQGDRVGVRLDHRVEHHRLVAVSPSLFYDGFTERSPDATAAAGRIDDEPGVGDVPPAPPKLGWIRRCRGPSRLYLWRQASRRAICASTGDGPRIVRVAVPRECLTGADHDT